jgi:four helix bundle protein
MRESAKSFKDLIVWQKAHLLTLKVYKLSKGFPKEEQFGLVSQIRRAAVSIAANIAEGFTRKSNLEKQRFLNISQGSHEEVRYYLILSKDLGYCDTDKQSETLDEVSRILSGYMRTIK